MLTDRASARLSVIRFPLIVLVVFIHAYQGTVVVAGLQLGPAETGSFANVIRAFISQGVARTAVPLFFLMSGYLFFIGIEAPGAYARKLRDRCRTLLLPFLFWNVLCLLGIALAQSLPQTSAYFSGRGEIVRDYDAFGFINAILGITRMPVAYQFWFIRDLMLLVVMAPLIFLIARYLSWLAVALAGAVWLAGPVVFSVPSVEAFLFFLIGSVLAQRGLDIFVLDRFGSWFFAAFIFLVALDVLLAGRPGAFLWHKMAIISGVPTFLWLTGFLVDNPSWRRLFVWLAGSSFFVYAAHEPVLTILRKLVYHAMPPHGDFMVVFWFFTLPVVVITGLIVAFSGLRKVAPRFASLITGGR